MPKTTAIVSAYKCAGYLTRRIQNLCEQTAEPDIICICQLGSAEEEILNMMGLDTITTPGIPTLYTAWNMAVKRCQTEYLVSANADDLFEQKGIERLESLMDRYDIGIGRYKIFDKRTGKTTLEPKKDCIDFDSMRWVCQGSPMPIWKKELHDRLGMFKSEFVVAGDYEFWLRCILHGAKIGYTPEIIGTFESREDSLSHQNKKALKQELLHLKKLYRVNPRVRL